MAAKKASSTDPIYDQGVAAAAPAAD